MAEPRPHEWCRDERVSAGDKRQAGKMLAHAEQAEPLAHKAETAWAV